tara:strand:- start:397 stop:1671 length:1275 start_codon:yes stop_codon:yes gene_type:complete
MGTPTNADKFSFSFWVKRSKLSAQQSIFRSTNGNNDSHVTFRSGDTLDFQEYGGLSTIGEIETNQVFRDVSAWYSILLVWDSGNSTAGNRMRMYVNGTEVTSFGTDSNPSQDADSFFNKSGEPLHFGRTDYSGGANYFSGYVCEMVMCDGQALVPSDIGEFDTDSPNIFKPIDVSGLTFGNNGFYLNFEDSSDLGKDVSGNNNHFTESNFSATDQSTDTCTNNFATLNPLFATQDSGTITEGNTIYTASANAWGGSGSTIGLTQGKWYFEIQINNNAGGHFFGVIDDSANVNDNPHQRTGSTFYYSGGQMYKDGSGSGSYSTFGASDIGGVYLNLDDNQISIYKNGSAIVTDFALSTTKNTLFVWVMGYNSGSDQLKVNFGGTPPFTISSGNADANGYGNFEYSPTLSGVNYYSINTKNLAEFG